MVCVCVCVCFTVPKEFVGLWEVFCTFPRTQEAISCPTQKSTKSSFRLYVTSPPWMHRVYKFALLFVFVGFALTNRNLGKVQLQLCHSEARLKK